jgi:hypothetical protein
MPEVALPETVRDVITRLPRTFAPSFNDQLRQWDLLFPAEQRQFRAELDWLSRLSPGDFKHLFSPIVAIEDKMDLPRFDSRSGLSITDSGILARSPLYPQWRQEVARVFSQMDEGAGPSLALRPIPRVVASILPAGLPESKDPLWPEMAKHGVWVPLEKPFYEGVERFVGSLAARKRPEGLEDLESTWVFECEDRFANLAKSPSTTVLSWQALAAARREFLNRLNAIRRDLRSVDETHDDLRRMDIGRLLNPAVAARPQVREFVRGLMLSGNGSLVFPNSFVQWGASEALRRAQPQAMLACFGMRQKLKPFSSSVLFEDQRRGNPVGDAEDPAGSLIDDAMLAQYVYLAAQRVAAYAGHMLAIFAAGDLNRVLLVGAKSVPNGRLTPEQLTAYTVGWLESGR